MKKPLLFLLFAMCHIAKAQWCVPTTALPYNANMPGITHVSLNTINRFSADLENFPNNSYVHSGMSTELTPGQTYNFSISFTIDPTICPDMNIRVWIDFNQDYQFDDIGETVISVNNRLPGAFNTTFTIPIDALQGNTRMRVTAKMSPNGGHILPTPCDDPADPFGYHGEIEDYDIVITSATGIKDIIPASSFRMTQLKEILKFSYTTKENSSTSISISDVTGKLIKDVLPEQKTPPGEYSHELNVAESNIQAGIYLVVFTSNNDKQVLRIVVQ